MGKLLGKPTKFSNLGMENFKKSASYGEIPSADDIVVPGEKSIEELFESGETGGVQVAASIEDVFRNLDKVAEDETASHEVSEETSLGQEFIKKFPLSDLRDPKVVAKAATWVMKKADGDVNVAYDIMVSAGVVDTVILDILDAVKVEKEEATPSDEARPGVVLGKPGASDGTPTTRVEASDMSRRRIVGSYGIIVDAQELQLWKSGELVKSLPTEDFGGFDIMATEIDSIESVNDLALFFGDDAIGKESWLIKADPFVYNDPAFQKDQNVEMSNKNFSKDHVDQAKDVKVDVSTPPLDVNPKPVDAGNKQAEILKMLEDIEDALGIQEPKKHEDKELGLPFEAKVYAELQEILVAVQDNKKGPSKPKDEKPEPKEKGGDKEDKPKEKLFNKDKVKKAPKKEDKPKDEKKPESKDEKPKDEKPKDEKPKDEKPKDEKPKDEKKPEDKPKDDGKDKKEPKEKGKEEKPKEKFEIGASVRVTSSKNTFDGVLRHLAGNIAVIETEVDGEIASINVPVDLVKNI